MKYIFPSHFRAVSTVMAVALLATATGGLAATTAQMEVKGTITPAACSVSIEHNGIFDYGFISTASLSPTQANNLGDKYNNMQIACPSATQVGVRAFDNAATSMDGSEGVDQAIGFYGTNNLFGLGIAPGGIKLGAYAITLVKNGLTIDGNSHVQYARSVNLGRSWVVSENDAWLLDQGRFPNTVYSWVAAGQTTPLAAEIVHVPLKVTAAIKPLKKLPIGQSMTLQGSVTLSLYYL